MNLVDKSKDNLKLAKKNVDNNCHLNSVVSRIYYSVFQRMKHYLIDMNFDYRNFLKQNGYVNEKEYSHGTIDLAFKECFNTNVKGTIDNNVLYALGKISQFKTLYKARKEADYDEISNFKKFELEELYSYAEAILEIFEGESA